MLGSYNRQLLLCVRVYVCLCVCAPVRSKLLSTAGSNGSMRCATRVNTLSLPPCAFRSSLPPCYIYFMYLCITESRFSWTVVAVPVEASRRRRKLTTSDAGDDDDDDDDDNDDDGDGDDDEEEIEESEWEGKFYEADEACEGLGDGYVFAAPRTAYENQQLVLAMQVRSCRSGKYAFRRGRLCGLRCEGGGGVLLFCEYYFILFFL